MGHLHQIDTKELRGQGGSIRKRDSRQAEKDLEGIEKGGGPLNQDQGIAIGQPRQEGIALLI